MFYIVYMTLRVAGGEKRASCSKLGILGNYAYFYYQCHELYYTGNYIFCIQEMLEILDSHDEIMKAKRECERQVGDK